MIRNESQTADTDGSNRRVRLAFRTTGCKVNQFDSATVAGALGDLPVDICGPDDGADIVVVNACTVTMNADRDGRAAAYKAARTGARVIVAGCLATRLEDQNSTDVLPDDITVVGGTADRGRLLSTLRGMIGAIAAEWGIAGDNASEISPGPRVAVHADDSDDEDVPAGRSRPLIKIQDGCDCRCSYCIVPLVRGPSVSLSVDSILEQVRAAAESGAAEAVLTGVDLAAWGRTGDGRYGHLSDLIGLLIDAGTGLRFRLSSLEPYGLDETLLGALGHRDICPHLHIPMQSGADTVLTRMNRPYSAERFHALVQGAACRIPGLALGMDVIVGFPGETEAEFEETRQMVLNLPTTYLHVFPYSPRPGTPAATMPDQVPDAVKKERGRILRAIGHERRAAHAARLVGSRVEIVDIRPSERGIEALSADYTKVLVVDRFDMRAGRGMIDLRDSEGLVALGTDAG